MNFIPTTATAAEKLKRLAKNQRKESGTSLAVALDNVAKANGYANWKHVTACMERTKSLHKSVAALPEAISIFLADALKDAPPSADALAAYKTGLVFAMDVKDADGLKLGDDLAECDDAWMLLAADIWRVFVHAKDDETDTAIVDRLEGEDLVSVVQEDLMNYRFFRYTGATVPTSLDDAFARVLGRFFFPPTHVWLRGQFIDMDEVREVRVNGNVIFSSTPAGQVGGLPFPMSDGLGASPKSEPSALNAPMASRGSIIIRLDISKIEPGFYEYRQSHGGVEMAYEAGFSSIREAIESAADMTGGIRGFEVAYAGLVVGTYSLAILSSAAESIAQQAVETVAALGYD